MKDTEFLDDNNNEIKEDLFDLDIPEIEHVDEAADTLDDNELGKLKDDLKVKDAQYNIKISSDGNAIKGDFSDGSKLNLDYKKVTTKTKTVEFNDHLYAYPEEPGANIPEHFKEMLRENALNETMSIDMDMNKADDPAEVGFIDTEKELGDDYLIFDKLNNDLVKLFRSKIVRNKEIVYDDALIDKMAEYFAILDKIFDEDKDPSKIFFSPEDQKKAIDERKHDYKNNPFFVDFLKTEITTGFVQHSRRFLQREDLLDVRTFYNDQLKEAEKDLSDEFNPIISKRLTKGIISYDRLMDFFKQKLTNLEGTRQHLDDARLPQSQFMNGIDIIVLNTLKTKAAKNTFFKHCLAQDGKNIDLEKFTEKVNEMRREIRNDDRFKKMMHDRVPRGQFYKTYRTAVKDEISENKANMNQRSSRVKKDKGYRDFSNSYLKNNTYHIADDKMEVIQATYTELVELNKGKDPSDYMQKLMNAYETFIKEYGKNDGFVSGKAIDELNKRAVKYYDKRSGIIKGPNTGKGQGRLKTVEKLLKATDPLTKNVNKGLGTAYKKFEAEQKKAQPKVPGKA